MLYQTTRKRVYIHKIIHLCQIDNVGRLDVAREIRMVVSVGPRS
jgi:hypothetical protein